MEKDKPAAKNGTERKGIPVRSLVFASMIDLPGMPAQSHCIATPDDAPPGRPRYSIEYQPWLLHHCITARTPQHPEPQRRMIFANQVKSWEPLE